LSTGSQNASNLVNRALEISNVPQAISHGDDVERSAGKGQREHVTHQKRRGRSLPRSSHARQLNHPTREVQTDDVRAAGGQRERDVARTRRQIQRASAVGRRRQVDEPALPPAVLSVRQQHRNEIVSFRNLREQGSDIAPFSFRRCDAFVQRRDFRARGIGLHFRKRRLSVG